MDSILPESLNIVELLLPIWLSNSAIHPTSEDNIQMVLQRAKG